MKRTGIHVEHLQKPQTAVRCTLGQAHKPLGFADQGNVSHAQKRWFGVSSRQQGVLPQTGEPVAPPD